MFPLALKLFPKLMARDARCCVRRARVLALVHSDCTRVATGCVWDCASECGASSPVTRWPPFGSDPLNGWLLTRVEWSRSGEVPHAPKWGGQAGGQVARRA